MSNCVYDLKMQMHFRLFLYYNLGCNLSLYFYFSRKIVKWNNLKILFYYFYMVTFTLISFLQKTFCMFALCSCLIIQLHIVNINGVNCKLHKGNIKCEKQKHKAKNAMQIFFQTWRHNRNDDWSSKYKGEVKLWMKIVLYIYFSFYE